MAIHPLVFALDNLTFRTDEILANVPEAERRDLCAALQCLLRDGPPDAERFRQELQAALGRSTWVRDEVAEMLDEPAGTTRQVRLVMRPVDASVLRPKVIKLIEAVGALPATGAPPKASP